MNDIEKLALVSEMARKHGENFEIVDLCEYNEHQSDELSFHPNGNCGCILLDDDYAFDIRCNHLIWAEGYCEGIEYFWTENDDNVHVYNTILVYGNHKGSLQIKILALHEPDTQKDAV